MQLYLYLNEVWHADTWIKGGEIPIKPASEYKREERGGIYTPDENLIHKSEMDMMNLGGGIYFDPAGSYKNINIINSDFGSGPVNITNANYYAENGLILSFSSALSQKVMDRFDGKKVCVKILDVNKLKKVLDKRLGCKSSGGFCEYTSGHERNHFLKSDLDKWQAEYRLFWKCGSELRKVILPSGLSELVDVPADS